MKGNEYYKLKIKGFRYKSLSDPKYIKDKDELFKEVGNGWWVEYGIDKRKGTTRLS